MQEYERPPRYPAGFSTYMLSTHENGAIVRIHEDTWMELHNVPAHAIEFAGQTNCEWEPENLWRIVDRDAIRQSVCDERLLEQALAQCTYYHELLPLERLAEAEGCEDAWERMWNDTPESREAAISDLLHMDGEWMHIALAEVTASWD